MSDTLENFLPENLPGAFLEFVNGKRAMTKAEWKQVIAYYRAADELHEEGKLTDEERNGMNNLLDVYGAYIDGLEPGSPEELFTLDQDWIEKLKRQRGIE